MRIIYHITNKQVMEIANNNFRYLILLFMLTVSGGCKKLIEVDPPSTSLVSANVFQTDATSIAAMSAIYTRMSSQGVIFPSPGEFSGLSVYGSLSADELTLFNNGDNVLSSYYRNSLLASAANTYPQFWILTYNYIFQANSVLEGVNGSSSLSPKVKQQLLGEAKFIRAYCYFYLVNLYGDVPLVTGTDPKVNAVLPRSPKMDVYAQIVSDLKDAELLLSNQYVSGTDLFQGNTSNRVRPNKWVASALLARTYLYLGQYSNAEKEATNVIGNVNLYSLTALNGVFQNNSQEAIWQLQPLSNLNYNDGTTFEGEVFILTTSNGPNTSDAGAGYHPVYVSRSLLNNFEPGDDRASQWIGSVTNGANTYYFSNKYKVGYGQGSSGSYTESETVLRLGEIYLIRAEAYAGQGNTAGALADLNTLRNRARATATAVVPNPLPALTVATVNTPQLLVRAIEHERQVELFTEFGHRWFDLKRTKGFNNSSKTRADEVLPPVMTARGATWDSHSILWPIPQSEISADYKLVQNPGY